VQRLSGDDTRGEAVVGRISIHDPAHDLGVGVDVRRWNVAVGPDHLLDLLDENPGDVVELPITQLRRVTRDAALGAAVRDVHDGGLPGHEIGECGCMILVHGGVIAQAAFEWTSQLIVLHSEADMMLKLSLVVLRYDLHLDDTFGRENDLSQLGR